MAKRKTPAAAAPPAPAPPASPAATAALSTAPTPPRAPRRPRRRPTPRIVRANATIRISPRHRASDGKEITRRAAGTTSEQLPYVIHGRVESAVFNCPRCSLVIRFASATAIQQRCVCGLVMLVGLRIAVMPMGKGVKNTPNNARKPAPDAFIQLPAPELFEANTRKTLIEYGGRRIAPVLMQPVEDNDALVAELTDGSVDPLPILVLGVWTPGEPIHELSDPAGLTAQPYDASSHPLLAGRGTKQAEAEAEPEAEPEPVRKPGRSLLFDR